jgi:hypothetical protein
VIAVSGPVDADVLRLRSEFLSMPGLCLTPAQTARLLTIREPRAREALDTLVNEGFLVHTVSGLYRRTPALSSVTPFAS